MKLKVLGSSSAGNCYLLESEKECLVIEAGLPFMEVKKALDFNVRKIVGVLVSHSHGDHSKHVKEYKNAGIFTACVGEVFPEYDTEKMKHYTIRMNRFLIKIFPLVHDVPCYGFYITHPEIGSLVYATDTEYIKWRFKNVNHILVEANHSKELVDRDSAKFEHQITGHMDIDTTCEFLRANKSPQLRNVVLCHLSGDCADADVFIERARKVVDCPVFIANRGLEVDLKLLPF